MSALKRQFSAVQAILLEDWDPIGGAPRDEYDSYVWPALDLLRKRATRAELEKYLVWAADENMKSPVPRERLDVVLDKLMALDFS